MNGMEFEKEIFMEYLIERGSFGGNKEEIYDGCDDFLFLCSRSGRNR